MTPERHARIQQIFEAAVDLPTAQRDLYLQATCANDADLRRRIDQLIGADTEPQAAQSVKFCPVCSRCYDGAVARCPADAASLELALHGPLLIDGKYLIERRLGHGGMGAVYEVRHIGLEKTFALKLILAKNTVIDWYRRSFETEARMLGKLKHLNIVDVTDYGIDPRDGGLPYLILEYLEGETLRQVLNKRKSISFPEAAPMLRAIADAIDAAHAQDIIHADLKPGNLFLASGVIKVLDFGLARFPVGRIEASASEMDVASRDAETMTLTHGGACGTLPYMAPELFRFDPPSKASDLFAFGIVAYELLTGELAFGHEGCRSAPLHVRPVVPSSRAGLPGELDAPVLALLDPVPMHRPTTASAAVDAMEAAWLAARRRLWRAREIPRRMVFSALAAIAVVSFAALAAQAPVAKTLEPVTIDARFGILPPHLPDPRLLVVAIDEPSLAQDPRGLTQWSDGMAGMIEHLFSSGARKIAVDVLLPESWSRASEFTSAVLRHADHLVLAIESQHGSVIGTECIAQPTAYLLGPAKYSKLFGFVNLEEDEDRTIRHARAAFRGRSSSLAARAVDALLASTEPFWIDYSTHPQDIPIIYWKDVGKANPAMFRDRIIFIGATYAGSNDDLRVPSSISRSKIPGVVLEAEIANTIAANYPVRGIPLRFCLPLMALPCFGVSALALRYPHRFWISLVLVGTAAVGYVLAAFAVCRSFKWMAAVVAPELTILLAAGAAWMLKTRLSPYPGKER
jgi:CHASE2 domain-containing sensor protein